MLNLGRGLAFLKQNSIHLIPFLLETLPLLPPPFPFHPPSPESKVGVCITVS